LQGGELDQTCVFAMRLSWSYFCGSPKITRKSFASYFHSDSNRPFLSYDVSIWRITATGVGAYQFSWTKLTMGGFFYRQRNRKTAHFGKSWLSHCVHNTCEECDRRSSATFLRRPDWVAQEPGDYGRPRTNHVRQFRQRGFADNAADYTGDRTGECEVSQSKNSVISSAYATSLLIRQYCINHPCYMQVFVLSQCWMNLYETIEAFSALPLPPTQTPAPIVNFCHSEGLGWAVWLR